MKNIILPVTSQICLLLCVSCDFLEFDETNSLKTKEDIYDYYASTEQMLTHVYSFMPQDFGTVGGAMRECASDDAEFGDVGSSVQYFNNGTWSAVKTVDTGWSLYNGIRAANQFIAEIANVDFSRFEHQSSYENWMKKLKFFPYEARVLRAHYFFELARRYGDIAMPLTALTPEEANSIPKTDFDSVIDFIVSECDEAAAILPDTYRNQPDAQVGRVTRGFAMAVKSKALLYAASPLHNPDNDSGKWKKSAKAALDIIDTGLYSLDPNETANNLNSKEIVLMRENAENTNFELNNFPVRFTEGSRPAGNLDRSTFPSQNLVDAFETVNGYSVTLTGSGWVSEDPAFDPARPYDDRDPRFYRSVLANGMEFKGSTIETFAGGQDDVPITQGGSPTGYFLRKYIQPTTSFTPDNKVQNKHHWVIYRYAETLLTYAESMLNAFGSPDYTDAEFPYSARWALNAVRNNAGMPEVRETGKEAFLSRLYNEWRVEFAFEDHRFWDIRRWKIGDDTQTELYGVRIVPAGNGYAYSRFLYENRVWNDRMYLYPIPQNEIFNNRNLEPQNVGW